MKKIVFLLTVVLILSCLFGCSSVNDSHTDYAKKAIEITDKYLNYDISAEEAENLLETLRSREEGLPEINEDSSEYMDCYSIEMDVFFLSYEFSVASFELTDETVSNIQKYRNKLADTIGYGSKDELLIIGSVVGVVAGIAVVVWHNYKRTQEEKRIIAENLSRFP